MPAQAYFNSLGTLSHSVLATFINIVLLLSSVTVTVSIQLCWMCGQALFMASFYQWELILFDLVIQVTVSQNYSKVTCEHTMV